MKYALTTIAVIAVVLLILDRYFRINPYLKRMGSTITMEGMYNNGTSSQLGKRCGTDLYPCRPPLRCANGMCISEETTMPTERHPLPVLP